MSKILDSSDYFVYVHRRNDSGNVFYVGKGKWKRCHSPRGRNSHWQRIAEKHGFTVEVVLGGLTNEQACELEREFISFYGLENLANKTTGGDGAPGRIVTDEVRKHMSDMFKGKTPSQKTIEASRKRNSKPIGTVCGLRFSSSTEAVKYLRSTGLENACAANILTSLKGKSKHAYGKEWRYVLSDGNLASSKYKKPERRGLINDAGYEFDSLQSAAKWCIREKHSNAASITTCSTNIFNAIQGLRGVVYAYGFRWKHADDESPFREKKQRLGTSISCSNGMSFRSINSAAKFIGGPSNKNQHINLQIKKCCEGLIEEAYGYKWRFLDDSTS